jgi:hypothetical protein
MLESPPQGARNMPGSMCKGSLKHVTYPLVPPKMPQACMVWTQNMTKKCRGETKWGKGQTGKKISNSLVLTDCINNYGQT